MYSSKTIYVQILKSIFLSEIGHSQHIEAFSQLFDVKHNHSKRETYMISQFRRCNIAYIKID